MRTPGRGRRARIRSKMPETYHHGDLRQALVDASIELLSKQGPGAVTMRALARKLGVSHAAPKHHFSDKAALLGEVASRGFSALAQAMREAMDAAGNQPLPRLMAGGVAYVCFAGTHPEHFRLMFGVGHGGRPIEASVRAREAYEVLVDAVKRVLEPQGADSERIRVATVAARALVHGLAVLWLDGELRTRRDPRGSSQELESIARAVTALVATALENQQ
ncbi:MAG: TetR/AcrR family transcriptional regulator [Deltaproteobacteria bacterium]|nr:TetR/AcrR family transcriptional regulator [Deltaproteobacteria bacterium]